MALSTGVSSETLLATSIVYSDRFSNGGKLSGGVTIHNKITFTSDFDGSNTPGDVYQWFRILPHELGHRKQADEYSLYLTTYALQSVATALKKGSIKPSKVHGSIAMEIEAEYIQKKFNDFLKSTNYYRKDGTRGNKLIELFSFGIKDQDYLISEIDKLWEEYQSEQKENKEKSRKAWKEAEDLDEGTYTWNGSNWVRQ